MIAGVNACAVLCANQDITTKHDHFFGIRHRRLKPCHNLRKVNRADGELRNAKRPFSAALPVPSADAPR